MRTLHVVEAPGGGVGAFVNMLASELENQFGTESILVVAPDQQSEVFKDVSPSRLLLFSAAKRSSIKSRIQFAKAIVVACRAHQPNIIHLHSSFAGGVGRLLKAMGLVRGKVVYCAHGWAFSMKVSAGKRKILEIAERFLSLFCDRIIAISEHDYKEARKVGISQELLRLVKNGVKAESHTPLAAEWSTSQLRVLFAGRLDRQKGFDVLVNAIGDAAADFSVRVAGAALAGQPVEVDTPEHFQMLGWLSSSELTAQIRACDVLVVPSRWEGFGLIAVEAMRAGKAVVASDVGGLREIVCSGRTGLLVSPENSGSLRAALYDLDRVRCEIMGQAGHERFCSEFQFQRVVEQTVAVYREVLG